MTHTFAATNGTENCAGMAFWDMLTKKIPNSKEMNRTEAQCYRGAQAEFYFRWVYQIAASTKMTLIVRQATPLELREFPLR